MTRKRSLFVLVLLLVCGQARAASAVHGGRYRVILTEGAEAGDVFRGCACTIEGEGARFVILGSPATAMRLARDPRVATVEELSADTLRFEPGTEGRGVASDAVASWTTGTYAYDGAGNVVGIGSDVYTYDSAGRLATSSTSGIRQEYTYDRYGNLTSTKTISAGATQIKSAAVAANNRLSTSTGAQYDLSGRLTTAPDLAVVYDDMDMPVETTSGGRRRVHLYTVGDERIATLSFTALNDGLVGTDWTLRDTSGKVLRRLHQDPYGTWSWQQDYVYRDGSLLAAEVATAERTLHFFLDHLGTPRLITNHTGAQIAVHQYYPFGIEQTSPAQDRELLKYTGHERDTPTLDYMHARYYGTEWGRFLSVDPTWESADLRRPQSWNRYSYVMNNPVNMTDPDGRQWVGKVVEIGIKGFKTIFKNVPPDDLARAVKSGEDVMVPSRKAARGLGEKISDGKPPVHDPPHGAVEDGYRPHYHAHGRPKGWGHIFYGIAMAVIPGFDADAAGPGEAPHIEARAQEMFGAHFYDLDPKEKRAVLETFTRKAEKDVDVQTPDDNKK